MKKLTQFKKTNKGDTLPGTKAIILKINELIENQNKIIDLLNDTSDKRAVIKPMMVIKNKDKSKIKNGDIWIDKP